MKNSSQKKPNTAATRKKTGLPAVRELNFKRILVPIDFSRRSRQALQAAVSLARQHGGKLFLLHVIQPPTLSAWQVIPGGNHYLNLDLSAVADVAQKELDSAMAAEVPSAHRGRSLVRQGNAHSEIVEAARRLDIDLVVMSTHGHGPIERVLIGSVTERVVRHAPCSVLTLRQASTDLPPSSKWERILVPVDFSKTSLLALDVAVPLAREHRARLYLLSVVEPPPFGGGMESVALAAPDGMIAKDIEKKLPQVARRFVPSGVPLTMVVDRGRPFDVITRLARDEKVDCVVLTTHGYSGMEHFLLGSTAERVVRHAPCPVFVVRSPRTKASNRPIRTR